MPNNRADSQASIQASTNQVHPVLWW